MRIHPCHNPKSRTDLGRTISKSPPRNGLVRPAYKLAKLVAKTSSKVQELKTYN